MPFDDYRDRCYSGAPSRPPACLGRHRPPLQATVDPPGERPSRDAFLLIAPAKEMMIDDMAHDDLHRLLEVQSASINFIARTPAPPPMTRAKAPRAALISIARARRANWRVDGLLAAT